MNKPELFSIIASGGEYDDSWETTEFVTDDEILGQAFVDKMNALRPVLEEVRLTNMKSQSIWMKANPCPPYIAPKLKVLPRVMPKNNTKIFLKERELIIKENDEAKEIAGFPTAEWVAKHNAMIEALEKSYSEETRIFLFKGYEDTYWEMQPIAWL